MILTPWTVAHQAPLSMGFSRQEYCSGLPFPPPGNLPKSRESSQIQGILIGRWILYHYATWEGPVEKLGRAKDSLLMAVFKIFLASEQEKPLRVWLWAKMCQQYTDTIKNLTVNIAQILRKNKGIFGRLYNNFTQGKSNFFWCLKKAALTCGYLQ